MKAAYFAEHGGPEKVIYGDRPDPSAGPGEVVLRVKAGGLNHVDLLLLDGRFPPPQGLPHINGCEATGLIESVGPDVEGLAVGARVIAFPGYSCGRCEYCLRGQHTVCRKYGYLGAHRDGSHAELVTVPAENILALPGEITFEQGAAMPMAMLTSWHALVAQVDLRPGETVLVQAGGSGIGSAAIQMARLIGARVITTVGSDEKIAFARELGAEAVVNYRTQDFVKEVQRWSGRRGVDVVVEHIGAETFEKSIYCLTRLGRMVTVGSHANHWGRVDLRHVYSKNLRIIGSNLGSILELATLLSFVREGRLKPVVDRVFALSEAREAVSYLAERRNRGKVIMVPEG